MPTRFIRTTSVSGLVFLATVAGVGVMAVGNLLEDHADPAVVLGRQQERLCPETTFPLTEGSR